MPVKKLKDFLDRENVKYVSLYHSIAYTAQEIAASVHVKGKEIAKTVVVKLDGKMAMAVLPAAEPAFSSTVILGHPASAAASAAAKPAPPPPTITRSALSFLVVITSRLPFHGCGPPGRADHSRAAFAQEELSLLL